MDLYIWSVKLKNKCLVFILCWHFHVGRSSLVEYVKSSIRYKLNFFYSHSLTNQSKKWISLQEINRDIIWPSNIKSFLFMIIVFIVLQWYTKCMNIVEYIELWNKNLLLFAYNRNIFPAVKTECVNAMKTVPFETN